MLPKLQQSANKSHLTIYLQYFCTLLSYYNNECESRAKSKTEGKPHTSTGQQTHKVKRNRKINRHMTHKTSSPVFYHTLCMLPHNMLLLTDATIMISYKKEA